ncbi:C1 family peptidase [Asticcacaulis sp. 201]|uniref:C1 family peptidase n=1 Tax=Asticcacaulis sp. 201 TaxID=3028787 RepID=UPI002916FB28|nr:C1 family peptidase [Asticcacaulis sp. 201]MDV6333066.1 C1 family peptidase [Asticcacaulis sp. 201]
MLRRAFLAGGVGFATVGSLPGRSQGRPMPHGLRFLPNDEFAKIDRAPASRGAVGPRATTRQFLPPILPVEQEAQGSCVGWSVGYGLASALVKKRTGKQVITSPSYIYNRGMLLDSYANAWEYSCDTGMFIETALAYLQGFGILPWDNYPYLDADCARLPKLDEDKVARGTLVISGWAVADSISKVKDSLAAGIPALIGIQLRKSFDDYKGGIYAPPPSDPITGGHAMLVVGYDNQKGAFEVMNSWGTNWGASSPPEARGFAWISYDTVLRDATVDEQLRMYVVNPIKGT